MSSVKKELIVVSTNRGTESLGNVNASTIPNLEIKAKFVAHNDYYIEEGKITEIQLKDSNGNTTIVQ